MRDPMRRLVLPIAVLAVGASLSVYAWQSARTQAGGAGYLPELFLVAGLMAALLVAGLLIQRVQVAAREADLRASRDAIAAHEARTRTLLLRAGLGFTVTDHTGRILEANAPYARMLGFAEPAEIVGRSLYQFVHRDHGNIVDRWCALPRGTSAQEEIAVVEGCGVERTIEFTTIGDAESGATPTGLKFVSVCRDISARRQAQQDALENRRVFEDIFNNTNIAISDIDFSFVFNFVQSRRAAGTEDLGAYIDEQAGCLEELCRNTRLNNINTAGLELFGATSLKHLQAIDYFLQSDRPAQVREVALALWTGQDVMRKETVFSSFTGRDIAVIISLRLPRNAVEARRVPVVTLDVSDVRSAEGARRANLAKSQFLASMSHEIRTPLNGVIGNLELLAQTELHDDQEDLLFDAEKAAKSLLALIGNILDFSKIEAGRLTIENVELNPGALVQEAVDIVQSRARQKGIYVTGSIAGDVPRLVKGDPTRIRQILLNLLGNAVKFTSSGGVHVELVTKDWDDSICQLLFSVHDSGRGFHQSMAAALFQPFTQDYKRTTENLEGTGLGLSICKSLVDAFGGEFECESAPGMGSSFWFTLPVQVLKRAAALPLPDLTGRSALFVNATDRALSAKLAEYLAARGAAIYFAAGADEAVDLCRKALGAGGHIDIAVYAGPAEQWPAADYANILRELRTVPTVLAQAATPGLWRTALRCGASYLLPRDVDDGFLDQNIDQVLGGSLDIPTIGEPEMSVDVSLLAGKRVLVLEDRLVNQTIIQRQLKKLGISCVIAGDGVVGLEKAAGDTFDLILCDCSMPEMNGYEFTRILRSREADRDAPRMPVVAMTANAFREDMEKCFAAGMDDFLSKPVTLNRLASVISRWTVVREVSVADAVKSDKAIRLPNGHPVDIAALEDILGTSDRGAVRDILQVFVTAALESWQEVHASAQSQNIPAVTKAAHGAKGEARNAGAMALGDMYEELERTASESDIDAMTCLLAAIPDELRRVERFAGEFLGSGGQ